MTVERSVNDSAFEAAMTGPDDTWEEVAEQQAREIARLREREADIAGMLQVADGGQYRADWEAPIRRLVEWRKALQSLTPGGSEFQSPETCEAYVRDRLHRGQDLAKEVVRTYREITDLRERFHHCHKQAEDLNDTTCRECGLDLRNPIHRREEG